MKLSKLSLSLIAGLALLLQGSISEAQIDRPPMSGGTESSYDNVYGGLKWTFGEGFIPELVLGFRHADVNLKGNTHGADLSISVKIADGFQFGKLRAKYFNGTEDVQGEVSVGYDFTGGIFMGGSVNGPFSNLGVDYLYKNTSPFKVYFMIDSLKEYDKPQQSCPRSFFIQNGSCQGGQI